MVNNLDFNFLDTKSNLEYSTYNINNLNDIHNKTNEFSLLCMNIRSICKHFDEFIIFLNNCEVIFDVICLVETWLDDNSLEFEIEGYINFNYYRKLNKSDGISIYIRNTINVNTINYDVVDHCSSINFNLLKNNSIFNIICVYRSPSLSQNHFIDSVENYLNNFTAKDSVIFCGDVNINLQLDTVDTVNYLNVLSTFGFKSCINNTTRFNLLNNSSSCIDHIFYKDCLCLDNVKGYVCKNTITDHYTVILTLNKAKNGNINVSEIAENKKVERINFDLLKKLCKEETWYDVVNTSDINRQ